MEEKEWIRIGGKRWLSVFARKERSDGEDERALSLKTLRYAYHFLATRRLFFEVARNLSWFQNKNRVLYGGQIEWIPLLWDGVTLPLVCSVRNLRHLPTIGRTRI